MAAVIIVAATWTFYIAVLRPILSRLRRSPKGQRRPIPFFEKTVKLLRRQGYELLPGQTARELALSTSDQSYGRLVAEIIAVYERTRFGEVGERRQALAAGDARVRMLERKMRKNKKK